MIKSSYTTYGPFEVLAFICTANALAKKHLAVYSAVEDRRGFTDAKHASNVTIFNQKGLITHPLLQSVAPFAQLHLTHPR